jgi:hypothetical protein
VGDFLLHVHGSMEILDNTLNVFLIMPSNGSVAYRGQFKPSILHFPRLISSSSLCSTAQIKTLVLEDARGPTLTVRTDLADSGSKKHFSSP